ncbi:MAG TPA: hypothetical protein VGO61_11560 [Steroidobacteraceae bacterium]|jgi:hypothetical protein|nr:hypothetical protein [Steroidobacteraceae bacterium]
MKNLLHSLLLLLSAGVALAGPVAADANLAGKWQGRLEIAPGKTLVIQFVIAAEPDGKYSAVVTSPDDGAIKNVSAKSVKYADNQLTIDVPALSGGYAGTLRNGVLEGEWSQAGAKLPLSLKPYQIPTLTKADTDVLRGEWSGKINIPGGGAVTIVLRLSTGADGAMHAAFDVPEQGAKDLTGKDVTLDDGHFSVELPKAQAKVKGMLKGDQIVGEWNQLGSSVPLTLKKGRYVAPTSYLKFPAAAYEQLKGRWTGTLNSLAVVVRFETDAQGHTLGFFDSTQQQILNIPITAAELAGTKLNFALGFGAKFTGEIAGNKLTGEWAQPGLPTPLPLVLTREKDGAPIAGEKDGAPDVQDMTVEAAAPYLGLYWAEPLQRPMIVVLYKDRLALELPWRSLRELNKTAEKDVWSYVTKPANLVKFHRDGAGPATAMELRQDEIATLPRFEPEKGLPTLDQLFARRPDPQHAKKLAALGTIRMSGSIERTTSQGKGSFEILSAGEDRSRVKLKLDGGEAQIVVAGNRVWIRPQPSSTVQEMPEDMARATRLGGLLPASGDWRDEFKQVRVLKRIELDGKSVFLVHAAPAQGRQRLIYLDAENGLTRGYDEVYEVPGVGMVGCETRFADYREIEGVQIPFKSMVKYSMPKLGTWTYQVEKVETRLKLEKDPFTIK